MPVHERMGAASAVPIFVANVWSGGSEAAAGGSYLPASILSVKLKSFLLSKELMVLLLLRLPWYSA